ncbi:hypothetical protein VPH35_003467 [Triticum aestivum]
MRRAGSGWARAPRRLHPIRPAAPASSRPPPTQLPRARARPGAICGLAAGLPCRRLLRSTLRIIAHASDCVCTGLRLAALSPTPAPTSPPLRLPSSRTLTAPLRVPAAASARRPFRPPAGFTRAGCPQPGRPAPPPASPTARSTAGSPLLRTGALLRVAAAASRSRAPRPAPCRFPPHPRARPFGSGSRPPALPAGRLRLYPGPSFPPRRASSPLRPAPPLPASRQFPPASSRCSRLPVAADCGKKWVGCSVGWLTKKEREKKRGRPRNEA